jgi:hypothetical protein
VAVALGNGDGTFQPLIVSAFEGIAIGIGDFNADGRRDVVAAQHPGPRNQIVILPGHADGTLGEPHLVGDFGFWTSVLAQDFTGDSRRDLAIVTETSQVQVFPGHDDFTFGTPVSFVTGDFPRRAIAADFNGDGRRDIAVANFYGWSVTVALNQGSAGFTASDIPIGEGARGVTAADANGDGHVDLFVAGAGSGLGGSGFEAGHVTVLPGRGDGTFGPTQVYDVARGASEIIAGDVTGDGRLDLVTSNLSALYVDDCGPSFKGWDSLSVLPGNGDGTFGRPSSFALGDQRRPDDLRFINTVSSLTTNDLNRDGRLDLMGSNGALIFTRPPAPNTAPSVNAGVDRDLFNEQELVLTPSAVDADHHQLKFTWTRSEGGGVLSAPNPCVFLQPGVTTFTVTVDDGHGGVATDSVTYTLVTSGSNQPPVVSMTSPADGAHVAAPGAIALAADASDPDGTVTRVDFVANGSLIARDDTAPFAVTWSGAAPGWYSVSAWATDNHFGQTFSEPITVIVDRPAGSPPVLLADEFNDDTVDPSKWVVANLFTGTEDASIPVRETRGWLEIGPLAHGAAGSHFNGIASVASYDFRDAYASVHLRSPTQPGSLGFAMFAVGVNSSNYYRFYYSAGQVVAERRLAGTKATLHMATYDPARHRFLRIRHDAGSGRAIFETASESAGAPGVWEPFTSVLWQAAAVPPTAVKFELKAGTSEPSGGPSGSVAFDTFEAAPFTAPADDALLADDFSAAVLDASKWRRAVLSGSQDTALDVTQADGRLWIGPFPAAGGSHYNGILSVARYDLTNASARVHVPWPFSDALMMLTLPVDNANHYRVYLEERELHFEEKVGHVKRVLAHVPFDTEAHAFWRIRHDGATDDIVFETAPGPGGVPTVWTVRASTPRRLPITAIKFELKAGTGAPVTDMDAIAFDNFRAARSWIAVIKN